MRKTTLALLLLAVTWMGCSEKREPVRIAVVMKKYAVEPPVIRVPRGAFVELIVTTPDVQHGFYVPGLGIREPVHKSRPAVITFDAETPGEYPVECSILCGPGHDEMRGKIVIE